MKPAIGYGLVGILALSVLSLVDWVRENVEVQQSGVRYALGVLPNFAASVAIPFVMMSVWSGSDESRWTVSDHARRFRLSAAVAAAGLVAWEFVQVGSPRLVYDIHDLGATAAGMVVAFVAFRLVSPRAEGIAEPDSPAVDRP
jgi:putative flippase GtrA